MVRKNQAGHPIDPPLRVVVKISGEDKWLATEGGYDALQKTSFRLVAQMNFMQSEVEEKFQKIIGKTVFSTALTDLLKTDFSSADLARPLTRHLSRVATPNLTPIKIVEAVYLPNVNAVALKVSTGDGEDRLLWGDMSLYNIKNSDMTFLERTGINVLEKIPKSLTEKEIIAIKKGRIFRGMSEDALLYCIGAPEKINNWGQGGQQNIYYSNTLYIYVAHGRVTDWQSLN